MVLSSTLLIHTLVPLLIFGSTEAITFQHLEHLFVDQAVITKRYRSITRDMGMRGFTVLLTATLLSKPIETLPDALEVEWLSCRLLQAAVAFHRASAAKYPLSP